MADIHQIALLLNQTLSSDGEAVLDAIDQLDRLSVSSDFTFSLFSLVTGDGNQGQRIAAATYLKNLIRRNAYGEGEEGQSSSFSKEFKDRLMGSLLRVELPVLRVFVEAFRFIVDAEFVKKNSWPEFVPGLRCAIQNSDFISGNADTDFVSDGFCWRERGGEAIEEEGCPSPTPTSRGGGNRGNRGGEGGLGWA